MANWSYESIGIFIIVLLSIDPPKGKQSFAVWCAGLKVREVSSGLLGAAPPICPISYECSSDISFESGCFVNSLILLRPPKVASCGPKWSMSTSTCSTY